MLGSKSWYLSLIFLRCVFKILVLKDLWASDPSWSGQNPEEKGLTGKILRNKELAAVLGLGVLGVIADALIGSASMIRFCAFRISQ